MASAAFEDIAETLEFLEDWEERYRHIIELGKAMPVLDEALRQPATKVQGCASQVWIVPRVENGIFTFQGDSDAIIVRGLVATLGALYNGLTPKEVLEVDAMEEFARIGLKDHLSAQRSNGVRAMVERIREAALAA